MSHSMRSETAESEPTIPVLGDVLLDRVHCWPSQDSPVRPESTGSQHASNTVWRAYFCAPEGRRFDAPRSPSAVADCPHCGAPARELGTRVPLPASALLSIGGAT